MNRKHVWLAALGGSILGGALPLYGQSYIGAKRCAACHPFEFSRWEAGPHAHAHESLNQKQLVDPKCNTCHTMAPEEDDARLLGIQCERCHGAGKYYHPAYVMKDQELARIVGLSDVGAPQCLQCHTEGAPSIAPFDFKEMWSRIDHGEQARTARERVPKPPHERSARR